MRTHPRRHTAAHPARTRTPAHAAAPPLSPTRTHACTHIHAAAHPCTLHTYARTHTHPCRRAPLHTAHVWAPPHAPHHSRAPGFWRNVLLPYQFPSLPCVFLVGIQTPPPEAPH
ncbi:hypothetical protein BU17DRAFT_101779 [Hysterangium stoloniferum]|nr:hypothetical protein BU17DRAFT_101779 [Hysterangium stoloniferum]